MGPITHRYSEIFWTALPQTPVPPEIVKRFAGKGMVRLHQCKQSLCAYTSTRAVYMFQGCQDIILFLRV